MVENWSSENSCSYVPDELSILVISSKLLGLYAFETTLKSFDGHFLLFK